MKTSYIYGMPVVESRHGFESSRTRLSQNVAKHRSQILSVHVEVQCFVCSILRAASHLIAYPIHKIRHQGINETDDVIEMA